MKPCGHFEAARNPHASHKTPKSYGTPWQPTQENGNTMTKYNPRRTCAAQAFPIREGIGLRKSLNPGESTRHNCVKEVQHDRKCHNAKDKSKLHLEQYSVGRHPGSQGPLRHDLEAGETSNQSEEQASVPVCDSNASAHRKSQKHSSDWLDVNRSVVYKLHDHCHDQSGHTSGADMSLRARNKEFQCAHERNDSYDLNVKPMSVTRARMTYNMSGQDEASLVTKIDHVQSVQKTLQMGMWERANYSGLVLCGCI